MLINVASSGEASAKFCLPAWGKDIAKRLAKSLMFLLYEANLYFFTVTPGVRGKQHLPIEVATGHTRQSTLHCRCAICHKILMGFEAESFILMESFSLMQKRSWEIFFLSNQSIKVCISHTHPRTWVYRCGTWSDF